jgi:tetratricopeptide (TPR) repeat protein
VNIPIASAESETLSEDLRQIHGVTPGLVLRLAIEVLTMRMLGTRIKDFLAMLVVWLLAVSPCGTTAREFSLTIAVERPVSEVLRDAASALTPRVGDVSLVRALTEIARAQICAGDEEGAVATARRASELAVTLQRLSERFYALIEIGRVRVQAGDRAGGRDDIRSAKAAVVGGVDAGDRLGVLREIAVAQARSGDRQAVDSTLREMNQAILATPAGEGRFGLFSELVAAQAAVGDFDGAFRNLESAGEVELHKGALLGLIAKQVGTPAHPDLKAGEAVAPEERQARRRALARIAKEAESIEQDENRPDVPVALAMAEVGECNEALRIARRFFKRTAGRSTPIDPTPEPFVLSKIAVAQGKAGRLGDAHETFREALEKCGPLIANGPGHSLDEIALDQVAAGDFAGALKTLDAGPIHSPSHVLTALAQAQARIGDASGSRTSYLRAIRELYRLRLDVPPPPTPPAGAPPSLGTAHHRRDDNLLARLAAIQASSGDLKGALRTLDTINNDEPRAVAVREIARARASAGDAEGTFSWALTLNPSGLRLAALEGLAMGISSRGSAPRRDTENK